MPTYVVTGTVVGSKYMGEFEADSLEEAVEKALESDEAYISFCHYCASKCEDPQVTDAVAELKA